MQKSIRNWNHEYNSLLATVRKKIEGERVRHKGQKGRVQSVHLNAKGVRIDILLDSGQLDPDIDALLPEYDPF